MKKETVEELVKLIADLSLQAASAAQRLQALLAEQQEQEEFHDVEEFHERPPPTAPPGNLIPPDRLTIGDFHPGQRVRINNAVRIFGRTINNNHNEGRVLRTTEQYVYIYTDSEQVIRRMPKNLSLL